MKQKQSKTNYRRYVLLGCLAAVILGLIVFLWVLHDKNKASSTADNSSSSRSSGINYGPATKTEKQDSQAAKAKDLGNTSQPKPSTGGKQVQIQVIQASASSVRANVIGVFEDGGTCTATYTKGTETHIFTSTGITSSNYTQCQPIEASGIAGSGWSVVVTYSSTSANGKSQSIPVN